MSKEKPVGGLGAEGFGIGAVERPGSTSTVDSNEDLADFVVDGREGYAWVFDGASALAEPLLDEGPTDGRWYVEEFNDALKREIEASDQGREIEDILENAVESVREAYEEAVGMEVDDISDFRTPSAKISLARWNLETQELETYGLGDSVQLTGLEAETDYVKHGGPEHLDKKVFEAMKLIQRPGQDEGELEGLADEYDVDIGAEALAERSYSHGEVMGNELVQKMLRDHRAMKNEEGGYWTLGFDTEAVRKGVKKAYDLENVSSVALFTDGVSPAVETYEMKGGRPYTGREFLEEVEAEGMESMMDGIERYEGEDPDCERHVRFKESDDKALAYIRFS